MDVTYDGIRMTPEAIVARACETKAHVVGLSILSGSHLDLVRDVVSRMRAVGLEHVPVIVGGIIPPEDARALTQFGVAAVYTPKDFKITDIMGNIVKIVDARAFGA
jgi:(2R)-ethylmalonyl-CoA mutase